MLLKPV